MITDPTDHRTLELTVPASTTRELIFTRCNMEARNIQIFVLPTNRLHSFTYQHDGSRNDYNGPFCAKYICNLFRNAVGSTLEHFSLTICQDGRRILEHLRQANYKSTLLPELRHDGLAFRDDQPQLEKTISELTAAGIEYEFLGPEITTSKIPKAFLNGFASWAQIE